ncbi:unnamed protein product [Lactuca virosa]|uniref:Uncharacterized protein n=1 Tax=Lactuca virosa TaxID=75947 RepID=A0AAU9LRE0_9ASTR|nr:unnamed protein product [Lactuca virosa]
MPSLEIEILSVFDVFSASAYGDLLKLRKFVEDDVVSLSQPDANGYYPLQWASVNNFPDVAQYIIEAVDGVMQTALHWAAVGGSVAAAAADVLLQNGAILSNKYSSIDL